MPCQRLHQTAPLVGDVPDPVGLARRNQQVRAPTLDVPVQVVFFVNGPLGWILHLACVAVVVAILAVGGRVDFGEDVGRGGARGLSGLGEVGGGGAGGQQGGCAAEE